MVSSPNSRHYRFTVHYTRNASVLFRVLNVLGGYGMEPAWLLTHIKSKRSLRLDVGLTGTGGQYISAVIARIANLDGVKTARYEITGKKESSGTREEAI